MVLTRAAMFATSASTAIPVAAATAGVCSVRIASDGIGIGRCYYRNRAIKHNVFVEGEFAASAMMRLRLSRMNE